MKYIEHYDSIRAFKADLNSPECICAAQVPTPVGTAMGYQQDGEFIFTVSGTVISKDSLRTIDLSSFDKRQINISAVQTFINTCNVGDKMIFNPTVGIKLMDSLNINDKAHWDGFNLILGVKEDDLYPFVKVWLTDGSTDTYDDTDTNRIADWFDKHQDKNNIIKVTLGEYIERIQSSTLWQCVNIRYFVCSKKCIELTYDQFGSTSKIQTLTINNPNPPGLGLNYGLANCQRIYVPKGSKQKYVKETNWNVLANKIFEV